MLKTLAKAGLTALAATALPGAASAQFGPDSAACRAGRPSILVTVDGFSQRTGNIRVALYGGDPSTFLARGQTMKKINLRVSPSGPMRICVAVPQPGRYAIAVRHDVDGDNARGDWSDGGGFSRNPHISLLHLRPNYGDVAINVGQGMLPVHVTLLYRYGFSIRPGNS
jgi:uncharacterized protein (DUF2141 family)